MVPTGGVAAAAPDDIINVSTPKLISQRIFRRLKP